ncbi:major facilitator superfamily protein [Hirsutella rhossiliensis]|uniref:Major facilitator superfamily domain-containing protein n=1 Tax=Hirsutella rhossiliensis TaxID=111463 RepID=A0A9P8N980_9HYPO|nr:major facilitator superfamily domain-containing protein [Hirsutella rhossiliensis]KAH0968321.1 major facilitator superfamily domain-containing protein [Hirsutella rhossiliensis]
MADPTEETRQDGRRAASETDPLLENRGDEAQHVGEDPADGRERWNHPRVNRYRYVSVNLSLLILGMHDGSIGLERYYAISYATVSTLFLVPFLGYVTAALCNNWIHHRLGRRGVAFLGPAARLLGYIPMALHPPFPVLPVLLLIVGFGNGIQDSAWNTWVGNMHQANELLGIIHGSFGLGGTVAPLIVSAMVAKMHLEWYTYFYVTTAVVCVELVFAVWAFWGASGAVYRKKLRRDAGGGGGTIRTVLSEPITWLVSVFLLAYAGAEVSMGGWTPTFMIEVRHADNFLAGVTATLFWLGLSLGRVVLGFITGRIGEKLAITGYLLFAVAFELLFWLVPTTVGAMCFVFLMGFFLGPLFPAAVVVATKLLPPEYHITAVGFAAAIGGGGASVLPFAVGAIAENHGVQVLQPIILAVLLFLIGVWLALPGGLRKGGLDRAQRSRETRT